MKAAAAQLDVRQTEPVTESPQAIQIAAAYRFLVDAHGFSWVASASDARWKDARAVYTSATMRIEVDHNDRDDFDSTLHYPDSEQSSVSVGVLESALRSEERSFATGASALARQATFVRTHLERLAHPPADIVADFRELRFYHTPRWRAGWGRSIAMDAATITSELQRLDRLRVFFGEPSV